MEEADPPVLLEWCHWSHRITANRAGRSCLVAFSSSPATSQDNPIMLSLNLCIKTPHERDLITSQSKMLPSPSSLEVFPLVYPKYIHCHNFLYAKHKWQDTFSSLQLPLVQLASCLPSVTPLLSVMTLLIFFKDLVF